MSARPDHAPGSRPPSPVSFTPPAWARATNSATSPSSTAPVPLTETSPAAMSLVTSVINCRFQLRSYTAHRTDPSAWQNGWAAAVLLTCLSLPWVIYMLPPRLSDIGFDWWVRLAEWGRAVRGWPWRC